MRYRIAELITEVPSEGEMDLRCIQYAYSGAGSSQIIVKSEEYCLDRWKDLDYKDVCYLESGLQYYGQLVKYNGILLHASAIELYGRAYLFSGPSGMGKSTHAKLWQQVFGPAAQVFNDDKPALRYVDGKWYAYGTPWCGKDGINQNKKVGLAGICFLKRGDTNTIRELSAREALKKILPQTRRKFPTPDLTEQMLKTIAQLLEDIPVFELQNKPEPGAAKMSYNTMHQKAEEVGL